METGSKGTGRERRSGLSGHIKLVVISITMELNSIVAKDVAMREKVNNKQ
jgi:hypothetical protein